MRRTHQYLDDNPDAHTVRHIRHQGHRDGQRDHERPARSQVGLGDCEPRRQQPGAGHHFDDRPGRPAAIGNSSTVSATFTDVGTQDTHKCTFTWDDATPATTVNATGGTCSATHTYAAAGVYTVTVTVTDDDTGRGHRDFTTFIVIYDPGGGFVTGGGWINSTAGSCKLTTVCEGATGKANFGFVSKYKKGASVPTVRRSSSSRPAT